MTTNTGQTDIDRVRDATDLVRLISEHVSLTPRGREHVGICPFHDDHKPSMAVVTHKGNAFYNCFACGASGDCFRFAMDYHKMDFGEALRYLADRAGVTLTPRSPGARPEGSGDGVSRSDLLKALDFANDFFRKTLQDPELGATVRATLVDRGLDDAMVERFSIGAAAPGFSTLLDRLGGKASAIRTATAAGLLRERTGSNDGHYDTFRNRLIFPIQDEVGRTIAFGARIVDPEDQPKYLNSPESPVFHKSKTLYGLHLARRAIIASGEAIVTEGYTDVIACHRAGIENVVGTLGTALTTQHASILARLCPSVVLVFDGDEAGRKAADRAIEVFFREPVDMKICVLPEGQDPDDLLGTEGGRERFDAAVAAAVDALEYKLSRFQADLETTSGLSGRQRAVEAFLRELSELGFASLQGVRKRFVLTRLADLTGLPIPEVEAAIPRPAPARRVHAETPTDTTDHDALSEDMPVSLLESEPIVTRASRARAIAERDVLSILLVEPAAGREACIPPQDETGAPTETGERVAVRSILTATDFTDPIAREIASVVFRGLAEDTDFGMSQVLAQLPAGPASGTAAEIFREGTRRVGDDPAAAESALIEAVTAYRRCVAREAYRRAPAAAADVSTLVDLLRKRTEQGDVPAAISQGVRS